MGLMLGTQFRASAVPTMYGGYGAASVPGASTVPEGPMTITQQAFGVPPAGGGSSHGIRAAAISTGALILLALIWWTLPR